MAIAMPHTDKISQTLSRTYRQRLLTAQFAGGYIQQAADGLNSVFEELQISWELVTLGERNTIIAALKQAATDYLEWTPADDGVTKRYIVIPDVNAMLYNETQVGGQIYNISTNLIQVRG